MGCVLIARRSIACSESHHSLTSRRLLRVLRSMFDRKFGRWTCHAGLARQSRNRHCETNMAPFPTRLFVPLRTAHFRAFAAGNKTWELRLRRRNWTSRHVLIGRRVELRHGYSGLGSVWGNVVEVYEASSISYILARVPYRLIVPDAASKADAVRIAATTLGASTAPVIAFCVKLDAQSAA